MSAFFKEILCCDDKTSQLAEKFVIFLHEFEIVSNSSPWAKNGLARIYLDLKSQNRFPVIHTLLKTYYDCKKNEIIFKTNLYGNIRHDDVIDLKGSGMFSGAKSREQLKYFLRRFRNEKEHWY